MMNTKQNLLMISYPFPPNPSAGAVRSERFARQLSLCGWNIDVLTIKPQDSKAVNVSDVWGDNITIHRTRTVDPWLWMLNRVPNNIVLRGLRSVLMKVFSFPDHMLLWLPFALFHGLRICRNKNVDVIYSTSPPHSSHLIGYLIAKITGLPWVADFRDPWTLNAYRNSGVVTDWLIRLSEVMERAVYRTASVVIANTKANRRNLLRAFKELNDQKVVYLPNGWEPFDSTEKASPGENRTFTIVHAGTFYPRFKPYALFYAIEKWKNGQQPGDVPGLETLDLKIKLFGSKDSETRGLVQSLGLEKYVEIVPWIPQSQVRREMGSADLLWVTLGTGNESSTYVPSKLFEYIAARRPIIGFFPDGEAAGIIQTTKTGRIFSDDSPEPIIQYLYECMRMKQESPGAVYNPDEEAVKSYNVKEIVQRLSGLLTSLCKDAKDD